MQTERHETMLMSLSDICRDTGFGRTSIWRLRQAGKFPEPIDIGVRVLRWRRSDIEEWLEGNDHEQ